MPRCALPPHLDENHEIENNFPDDSQYGTKTLFGKVYRWYNKTTKTWFAFSYRCKGWLKWRKFPVVLFAVGGRGPWRLESEQGDKVIDNIKDIPNGYYLSRIQWYKRWHFSILWPLMFYFHFYPKKADVPVYLSGQRPASKDLKGKVWFAYWNHFDADFVYWMITSAYLGKNFK